MSMTWVYSLYFSGFAGKFGPTSWQSLLRAQRAQTATAQGKPWVSFFHERDSCCLLWISMVKKYFTLTKESQHEKSSMW